MRGDEAGSAFVAPPHPALCATFSPRGEKRERAAAFAFHRISFKRLYPRPEKSAVGLLHVYLAGALESADD